MVKANTRHSRHHNPLQKTQQGSLFPEMMGDKLSNSGEESREEFNLSFPTQNSTIRGHRDTSIPSWDTRGDPPSLEYREADANRPRQISNPPHYGGRSGEAYNQWDTYSAQAGLSRQIHDANTKNIWSSEKPPIPKSSDASFYSASTNPSIGPLSLDTHDSYMQRHYAERHNNNMGGISESFNQLHLQGTNDDNKASSASVASSKTYSSNTVPDLIGASSGSTGGTGESSLTGSRYQSNYSHVMNSDAKIFYPGQNSMQQHQLPPPGFGHNRLDGGTAIHSSDSISVGDSTGDSTGYRSAHNKNNHHRRNTRKPCNKRREGHEVNYHNQIRSEIGHDDYSSGIYNISTTHSSAIRTMVNPRETDLTSSLPNRMPLDRLHDDSTQITAGSSKASKRSILPSINDVGLGSLHDDDGIEEYYTEGDEDSCFAGAESSVDGTTIKTQSKKKDWLLRMNRRLTEIPIGELDPSTTPISAIMNSWAKTKSCHGASMVEKWLNRAQEEFDIGNTKVVPTNKMFTMAVDAWAKSGEGVSAAQRAETILQHMHEKYQLTGHDHLRPTTGIFNAVINAWARSKEKIAPSRAEQILKWMDNLHRTNPSIKPDKYTFNTGKCNSMHFVYCVLICATNIILL